jgi:hypothetical protein
MFNSCFFGRKACKSTVFLEFPSNTLFLRCWGLGAAVFEILRFLIEIGALFKTKIPGRNNPRQNLEFLPGPGVEILAGRLLLYSV